MRRRQAQERDLKEGTQLFYGDKGEYLLIGFDCGGGAFSVMRPDGLLAHITKHNIVNFEVEVEPLTLVE